jgi:hypothetical protein
MPHYQLSSYMGTDGRPLFTMDDNTHFLSFADPTQFIIKAPVRFIQSLNPYSLLTLLL